MSAFKLKLAENETFYRARETKTFILYYENNNFKKFEVVNKPLLRSDFNNIGFEVHRISISEFERKFEAVEKLIGFELGKDVYNKKEEIPEYTFYDLD